MATKVEPKLADKLKEISAKIVDIKLNPVKNVGVVSVELTYKETTWHKPFAVNFSNKIAWSEFVAILSEEIRKDFDKDTNLAEIKAMEGKDFKPFDSK
jgi:hypothetical protein